jgi:hypothetical protein
MTHHTQASEKKTATFNVTMVTAKRDFHCSTRSTRDVENDEIPQHSAVFFFLHEFESESVWVTAIQLFLIERNISRHIHKCSLAKSSSIVGSQYFAHRS